MTALYCRIATVLMMIPPVQLHLVATRKVLRLKIVDVRHVHRLVLLLARLEAVTRHHSTDVTAVLRHITDRSLLCILLTFRLTNSHQIRMMSCCYTFRKVDTNT